MLSAPSSPDVHILTKKSTDLKQFDEVLKYVNELSNTIDLSNTRLRAEVLFRRFQRTVEAVDRKKSALGAKGKGVQRRQSTIGEGSSSTPGAAAANVEDEGPEISDDLRRILSREIIRP